MIVTTRIALPLTIEVDIAIRASLTDLEKLRAHLQAGYSAGYSEPGYALLRAIDDAASRLRSSIEVPAEMT